MKKYALFFSLMMMATMAFSQVRFGIKGGLVTSSLNEENISILDQGGTNRLRLALQDANYGVTFGFLIRAELGAAFIQPEVNFRSNSVNFHCRQSGC